MIIVAKWIANCPRRLMNREGWKMDVKGRTLESLSKGFDRETDMNETDPKSPNAVIWVSPYLTPSR